MTKANDLFKDQLIGEEIYFGKPEDRPEPKVGDRCWVMVDFKLFEHEVIRVTPKRFDTKSIDDPDRISIGIDKKRFRIKD